MSDCINREDALLCLTGEFEENKEYSPEELIAMFGKRIRKLPPVTPTVEWVPVSERLPEEEINPITQDYYEYQCTYKSENVCDVRHYKFGRGHWWHGPGIMDEYVTAWMPRPKPWEGKE